MRKDESARGRKGEIGFSGNFLKPVFKASAKVALISRHDVGVVIDYTALKSARSVFLIRLHITGPRTKGGGRGQIGLEGKCWRACLWAVGVLALRPCALPTWQQFLVHSAHTTSTVIATVNDARL